jgi:hypothetical protein
VELIPTILDQLHSEVTVKTALSAAQSERWLEIPFQKLFVLAATGNSWFVGHTEVIAKNGALNHRQVPSGCGHAL